MKDLYDTLGIKPDASPQEIKKAYRRLALDAHPDKGGNDERMGLLNEAYQTLSDPERRRDFDADWDVYQEADVEQESHVIFDGYLQEGSSVPYSQKFREEHQALNVQYRHTPLARRSMFTNYQEFESNIYKHHKQTLNAKKTHDIFTFIYEKACHSEKNKVKDLSKPLTPKIAIKLLTSFLSGNYYGHVLVDIRIYLDAEVARIRASDPEASECLLYEGILEIFVMAEQMPLNQQAQTNHIFSIKKITDFAKKTSDSVLELMIPLFHNKFFRNLHAYAMHLYWYSDENLFDVDVLQQFDGYQESKELLSVLKDRLSSGERNEHLSKLIQYIKLIYHYEKDQHEASAKSLSAADYRESAFHFLDWLPIFIEQSSRQIIVNIFLQIGIKFQQASRLEHHPSMKMADEKLAFKMFLTAAEIGHNTTPDVGIYANTQAIKYILAFNFEVEALPEVIQALKKRTLLSSDIFPFFDMHQSNVAVVRQENKTLHLMRKLLNAMINAHEYNKTHTDAIPLDHAASSILYQAYEACLKNWYQETYDPSVEQKFRLELMEELLFDKGWTFLDVEKNLTSPWIMIDRNEEGWIRPIASLPYTDDETTKYRAINGAEINRKTGEINFFMRPWSDSDPLYEKKFTLFDLEELLEKNLGAGIFSLDPVDPNMPYHPYNAMRFYPSQLVESELLNTMLLTDYMLKFLTTNQEVQGQHPFTQRPVAQMMEHVPEYLRMIVKEFQSSKHSGALHRFWIEAEEIDVFMSDEDIEEKDITRIRLGELKMVVKKHRMERDIHGELKDVGNEDEGWPIYVLTQKQMDEVLSGNRLITGSAMIFIFTKRKLFYYENGQIIQEHQAPEEFRDTLIRLYTQPREENGRVNPSSKNQQLLYRITKEMAKQTGLSHQFSPEFIFAHEFTRHYDEFSQFLPEFGRLKELSRMATLVRCLDGIRKSNAEHIEALDTLTRDRLPRIPPDTEAYKSYHKIRKAIMDDVLSQFRDLKYKLSNAVLQRKYRDNLKEFKSHFGSLDLTPDSKEVKEVLNKWHAQISRDNPGVPSYRIWNEVINPQKLETARELSKAKKEQCAKQLDEIFAPKLKRHFQLHSYKRLIDSFIEGDIKPLADALVHREKSDTAKEMAQQLSLSKDLLKQALKEEDDSAVDEVAKAVACKQLKTMRDDKAKLESGFKEIHLGANSKEVNLEGLCFWVPATTRHEVKMEDSASTSRYSFFVYGGVNIQPRINQQAGGNRPLGGNRVGGNYISQNRASNLRRQGFQDHHIISRSNKATKNHELLEKAGFNNINARTNMIFLPKNESLHPTRTIHNGRHTQRSMDKIAERMDRIVSVGRAQNWNPSQYNSALRGMLSEYRQEFRAGNIALNVKQRPWAK